MSLFMSSNPEIILNSDVKIAINLMTITRIGIRTEIMGNVQITMTIGGIIKTKEIKF